MIDEIYVIEESGVPFYYYRGGGVSVIDNSFFTLQSGLFTALLQFGAELREGDLQYVVFDEKTYSFKKIKNLLFVVGIKDKLETIDLAYIQNLLEKSEKQIKDLIPSDKDSPIYEMTDLQIAEFEDSFGNFLVREKVIEKRATDKAKSFRDTVQQLAFKTIGYTPGVCNIGRTERLKRLTNGFLIYIFTLIIYGAIILIDAIPIWTTFFLILPLILAFMQMFQYWLRFCVRNAITRKYNMN